MHSDGRFSPEHKGALFPVLPPTDAEKVLLWSGHYHFSDCPHQSFVLTDSSNSYFLSRWTTPTRFLVTSTVTQVVDLERRPCIGLY